MTRGNLLTGEVVALDAARSTVYGQADKIVLLLGVEDLVVVDTEDALLVCAKGAAQRGERRGGLAKRKAGGREIPLGSLRVGGTEKLPKQTCKSPIMSLYSKRLDLDAFSGLSNAFMALTQFLSRSNQGRTFMSTFRLANPTIILLSAAAMALIAAFAPGPFSLGGTALAQELPTDNPPVNLRVTSYGHDWVSVAWEVPRDRGITYFILRLSNGWSVEDQTGGGYGHGWTQITVEPDTQYSFVLTLQGDSKTTIIETSVSFRTLPTPDPDPQDPPASDPDPQDPPASDPDPQDPPASDPDPQDPPASDPAPSTPAPRTLGYANRGDRRITHGQSACELSGYGLWARLGQRSMGGTARSGDHLFCLAIVKRLEC